MRYDLRGTLLTPIYFYFYFILFYFFYEVRLLPEPGTGRPDVYAAGEVENMREMQESQGVVPVGEREDEGRVFEGGRKEGTRRADDEEGEDWERGDSGEGGRRYGTGAVNSKENEDDAETRRKGESKRGRRGRKRPGVLGGEHTRMGGEDACCGGACRVRKVENPGDRQGAVTEESTERAEDVGGDNKST